MDDHVQNEVDREKRGEPASMNPFKIMQGLSKPRDSREYKEALIGLQRQSAPLAAILIPLVCIAVLAVVSATSHKAVPIMTTIATIPEDEPQTLDDIPPPPPPDEVPPPDTDINIVSDNPGGSTDGVPTPSDAVPVPANAARPVLSPMTMPSITSGVKFQSLGVGNKTGFGVATTNRVMRGALIGTMVDFKRDASGNPRTVDYWHDAKYLVDNNFTKKAFEPYFKLPKRVVLTHLLIPVQPADNGPEAFGVADLMKPSGWAAWYTGSILPGHSGRYRFIGQFDDMLLVMINGNVVLEATYGYDGAKTSQVMGWTTSSKDMVNRYKGPNPATPLVFGDWVTLDANKPVKLDLLIGERPGGIISGVLLVEEEGKTYEKTSDGRPIWPIFATSMLSIQDNEKLDAYTYKISTDAPPMNYRQAHAATAAKDDVKVDIGI